MTNLPWKRRQQASRIFLLQITGRRRPDNGGKMAEAGCPEGVYLSLAAAELTAGLGARDAMR
jgi:hypothetical protein